MAINLDNRVIHRFIRDISEYELGGKFYSQIIPLDTQAYAIYPNEEDNYLFYVIGDGEHTYTELRDGKGNGTAYREYPVLTSENLNTMIGGVEEEAKKRKEADANLQSQIDKEILERKEFDELLDEILGEEIQNRESSENAITEILNSHIENKSNPHEVTAEQIGLGNVDNTADLDKPISIATQDALDLKANQNDLKSHINDLDIHVTAQQKNQWDSKQDLLTAGTNINISNNVISTPSTTLNKVKNTVVQVENFVSDERYSGYKYRADVPVNGITSNDYPHVMFSIEDCVSNNYASFVESGDGYVSIWCKALPESAVTIPVITFE